jgi:hypothetical protein
MLDNAKNFSKVGVSIGYDDAAVSIDLITDDGAKLPTAPFNAVWWNYTDYADPSDDPNVEIVRVTDVTDDTLTIVRAQEDTIATTKNTGGKTYKMIAGLTAKVVNTDLNTTYLNLAQAIPQTVTASPLFSWLTAGRVPYIGAGGLLTDNSALTFATTSGLYVNGNLGLGTVPSTYNNAGNEYILDMSRTFTDATAGAAKQGVRSSITWNPTGSGTISQNVYAFNAYTYTDASEVMDNSGYMYGGYLAGIHKANSTVERMAGMVISAGTWNGASDTTGTINNLYGAYISGLKTASSTINTAYGLRIGGFSATTLYDIYAEDAGAKNYFAGSLGVGSNDPLGKAEIKQAQNTNAATFTNPHLKITASGTTNTTGTTAITLATSTVDNYGVSLAALRAGTGGTPSFSLRLHENSAAGTEMIRVNSTGVGIGMTPSYPLDVNGVARATKLILSDQPSARAYKNATQNIDTGTITKVDFEVESYDNDDEFDLTNDYYVATTAGTYEITSNITFATMNDGDMMEVFVYVGETAKAKTRITAGNSGDHTLNICSIMKLAAEDTVTIRVQHNHGTPVNLAGSEVESNVAIYKLA